MESSTPKYLIHLTLVSYQYMWHLNSYINLYYSFTSFSNPAMATRSVSTPIPARENVFEQVRRQIEEAFDSLIEKVNERREVLLRQLKQWEEEFNRTRASSIRSLEAIRRERDEMEECLSKLKINTARTSMEKGLRI